MCASPRPRGEARPPAAAEHVEGEWEPRLLTAAETLPSWAPLLPAWDPPLMEQSSGAFGRANVGPGVGGSDFGRVKAEAMPGGEASFPGQIWLSHGVPDRNRVTRGHCGKGWIVGGPAGPGDFIYQTLRKRSLCGRPLAASCPAGQEGQTLLLSWEGPRGGCGLQSPAEGGSHPHLTLELGTHLWGPLIPSLSWGMPLPRARVKQNGYCCVSPAPGSWDLLGSVQCPGRRVGGMGPGSSPGRLGTDRGTTGDPGPPAGPRFFIKSWEEPCQFHQAGLWGPSREVMVALWGPSREMTVAWDFSGNVRHYQVSLLGATSRNFPC